MNYDKHLDLGCGQYPRNPYQRSTLFGIDVHPGLSEKSDITYHQVNLIVQPIPFSDDFFDSVSAFDFIEHIPRQMVIDGVVALPFIALMNEVWRVLKPGGFFYAVTPAFPAAEAFQDPTHVNIITKKTHEYFCGKESYGRNYGFEGNFDAHRIKWVVEKNAHTADENLRKLFRHWHRRLTKGKPTHLLWELEAIK